MAIYETPEDRKNLITLLPILSKHFKINLKETPEFFPADLVDTAEKVYIEIRCRNCKHEQFSDFLISAEKIIKLLELSLDELSPQIWLCVAWNDAIGILRLNFGPIELVPFKRTNSRGKKPFDVMVSIPVSAFNIISPGIPQQKSTNWVSVESKG